MSKKLGFGYGTPYVIEMKSYGKREYRKRGNNQEEVVRDFLKYIKDKQAMDLEEFAKWIKGMKASLS